MYTVGIITISDKGAAGRREDKSGPKIRQMLPKDEYEVVSYKIIPDERKQIADELVRLSDDMKCNLVLTTGGTGFSPRDITPEATMDVAQRNAPGIAEALRAYSMSLTPRAMLGRGVCVIRKNTLIVNLPGSVKAVSESMDFLMGFTKIIFGVWDYMKLMKTTEAVGQVLCHDITQIIPGVKKDAVFRKGHIITKEDIPVLLSVGKDTIYIWENDETMMHENEAAEVLYRMSACGTKKIEADTQSGVSCGTVSKMHPSPVKEGKIEVIADCDGLLKVDSKKLEKVNSFGELMIATRHGNTTVKKGDKLAGTRIIPLVIKKDKLKEASNICEDGPILDIKPFVVRKAAIITTGNEVYHGRIQDAFTPVIEKKNSRVWRTDDVS